MTGRAIWAARTDVPVLETTVGGLLRSRAELAADEVALVVGSADPAGRRRWTYADLLDAAELVADALLQRFRPGEHVAVCAPNIAEWLMLQYGAALAGIVIVGVNPALKRAELGYILGQSRSVGVFHVGDHRGNDLTRSIAELRAQLPELRHVVDFDHWDDFLAEATGAARLPDVAAGDPALVLYTSGTTGFPKGAVCTHRGVTNNARFTFEPFGVGRRAGVVHAMPFFHNGGYVMGSLGTMQIIGKQICVESFDAALILELIETERAAMVFGIPTMIIRMLEHPRIGSRDLGSLRVVFSGGDALSTDLIRSAESAFGADIVLSFGQTESSGPVTGSRPEDATDDKANTVGQPLQNTEVKIVDPESGDVVGYDEVGELCVRGYGVMQGYFDKPVETSAAIDADGWLHTGDLCSMDARGYISVRGRLKDMIKRGGENIYPREVEDVLARHPAVLEAAVVGAPDAHWGEQVAAFVRLQPGARADADDLERHAREHLAHFKTPRIWRFVDEFPRTAALKIQKFALREQLRNEPSDVASHA